MLGDCWSHRKGLRGRADSLQSPGAAVGQARPGPWPDRPHSCLLRQGGKEYLMRAHFGLPSVEAEDKEGKPPISVKFEIPYFTTSGIQVRARAAGRRAAMDRPHEPHRYPESVQARRVVGDTQQCSQLRKGSRRLVTGAVVLPQLCFSPWAACAPTERGPHLSAQTQPCASAPSPETYSAPEA